MLELATVVAIVGLVSGMALTRWGDGTLATVSAQGFARSTTLSLALARRQAIADGTPAALVFNRVDGDVASMQVFRAESAGDVATDVALAVPKDVTVTTGVDRWEYDFTGTLTQPVAGGTIVISHGTRSWSLAVNPLTGHVETTVTP